MDDKKNVIVVVPAFNEQDNITEIILKLGQVRDAGIISDFIIIDDGSVDNTANIVEELGAHLLKFDTNKGKSVAVEAGIKYCQTRDADYIVLLDADTTDITPEKIIELLRPLETNAELMMTVANQIEGTQSEGYDRDGALRYNGIRAFRFSGLLSAYQDKEMWKTLVGDRRYPEAGLFLMFRPKEALFLPQVIFHNREMARGDNKYLHGQHNDIGDVQIELSKRKNWKPPRFR